MPEPGYRIVASPTLDRDRVADAIQRGVRLGPVPRVVVRSQTQTHLLRITRIRIWEWRCPDCASGADLDGLEALAAAVRHRWSARCKHRKGSVPAANERVVYTEHETYRVPYRPAAGGGAR